jgi:hypothetical protein
MDLRKKEPQESPNITLALESPANILATSSRREFFLLTLPFIERGKRKLMTY